MDYRTGQILDAIKQAGIEDDTLVIFTSDNGPEATHPWEGDNGLGGAHISLRWKARCALHSLFAGPVKCPLIASTTRLFTL
jgi:arylsulfatase A-like enzyme